MPGAWPVLHIASFNTPCSRCCHPIFSALNTAEACLRRASVWLWGHVWLEDKLGVTGGSQEIRGMNTPAASPYGWDSSEAYSTLLMEFLRGNEFPLPQAGAALTARPLLTAFDFCLDTLVVPVVIFQRKYFLSNLCLRVGFGPNSSQNSSRGPYGVGPITANV